MTTYTSNDHRLDAIMTLLDDETYGEPGFGSIWLARMRTKVANILTPTASEHWLSPIESMAEDFDIGDLHSLTNFGTGTVTWTVTLTERDVEARKSRFVADTPKI